jgi:hypothetical protein
VPDIAAGIFERLLAYVYKDEVDLSVMDTELVIALYYAGLLLAYLNYTQI